MADANILENRVLTDNHIFVVGANIVEDKVLTNNHINVVGADIEVKNFTNY